MAKDHTHAEQVAVFIGAGYVITLQERSGDCFENVSGPLCAIATITA